MKDALGHGSNPRGSHANGVMSALKPKIALKPDVLAHIRANPGGFSVTPKGKMPDKGFMVSLPGHTRIVSESDLSGPSGSHILNDYVQEHADVLKTPGAHIGGWTDKESGKTYLDVSHNISNRNSAIRAGAKRNQIAIWDVKKGREVRTGGTGE